VEDKKAVLIEKIKSVVVEVVHYADELPKINFSTCISSMLGYDYIYLSNLFSEVTGTAIEHFIIAHIRLNGLKSCWFMTGLTLPKYPIS
jgi:hypothetical protein